MIVVVVELRVAGATGDNLSGSAPHHGDDLKHAIEDHPSLSANLVVVALTGEQPATDNATREVEGGEGGSHASGAVGTDVDGGLNGGGGHGDRWLEEVGRILKP